jgi:hypothetical protein
VVGVGFARSADLALGLGGGTGNGIGGGIGGAGVGLGCVGTDGESDTGDSREWRGVSEGRGGGREG